jgi:chromosome segregation ATPase
LRTSERDFNELHTQLSNLEHRYSLLHDEKVKSDQEYKSRTESHLKQIANLKTDLETLKNALNERNDEITALSADFQAMQDLAELKEKELARCKQDLGDALETRSQLSDERKSLDHQNVVLREDKASLLEEVDRLNLNIDELMLNGKEQEKTISDLEYEKSNRDKQIKLLKEDLEAANGEIKKMKELNHLAEDDITQLQKTILECEEEIGNLTRERDRAKADCGTLSRQLKAEGNRNIEAESRISELEGFLKNTENELEQTRNDLDRTRGELGNALNINNRLSMDNEAKKQSIEKLAYQHQEVSFILYGV